jgi:hypothetical protein
VILPNKNVAIGVLSGAVHISKIEIEDLDAVLMANMFDDEGW